MTYSFHAIRWLAFSLVVFSYGHAKASVRVTSVDCPSISMVSLDRAITFYTKVLDFHLVKMEDSSSSARLAPAMPPKAAARTAKLSLGDECLDITEYSSPKGKPFPDDSRANDLWFEHIAIVVSNMNEAYERLKVAHVRFVSNIPQTLPVWNKEAGGISAFYFRDLDGHYLELIHFPSGKGQQKWQMPSKKTFLGIDHTAIAVSDTQRSIAFYRDKLHFRVAGSSENYGEEQEHLSGVFNAHVLITSLRAESGIGIELLDYVTPTSGRPIPSNLHVSDVARWQIPLEVSPGSSSVKKIDEFPNTHWIKVSDRDGTDREATWMNDPDGHLLELIRRGASMEPVKQ
ncbi:VOC family protein [Tunturiibacter empetritectus]|uniref:Catechol 2,3-dioxygenase-like lactoylglutathione lyase family enzyme n=1 Tax=Tunturiibacter lichenicola TaxID=2051959 RepID=A0A852VEQ9_9BACT|nr:VOC family protein [Edaphobacter lichenicola]NYF90140.1 catechol 2,3-dioxygenase-like lactoylglutathione lyase family enzyme [Edaphobacter lichenicola]